MKEGRFIAMLGLKPQTLLGTSRVWVGVVQTQAHSKHIEFKACEAEIPHYLP